MPLKGRDWKVKGSLNQVWILGLRIPYSSIGSGD
ncbi:hypothetical protein CYA_2191 [Synechococcus sp. JA-3-3Ab]|nr:hypothetical protein CYA_2191 [Synechococcus sp. JA-3-3Ab]